MMANRAIDGRSHGTSTPSRGIHPKTSITEIILFIEEDRCSLHTHPSLASSVRRIFFDGFYGVETTALIFQV